MVIFVNHRVTFFTTFLLQKFNWMDIAIIFDSDSYSPGHQGRSLQVRQGLEVIKLEFIPKLKVKRNDWLFADKCLQAANHCALF